MRFLVLAFPRLGTQLVRRSVPQLQSRPLALLAGSEDTALVAAASVEATAAGLECGMTAAQARQRCPAIEFAPDNASRCLDELETVIELLRKRTTTDVAIVSRNAIALRLDALESRFADEAAAASAIAALARGWSGLDVRAGTGSSLEEAVRAAGNARRFPLISTSGPAEEALLPRYQEISGDWRGAAPVSSAEGRVRLMRLASRLGLLAEEYLQSHREVRLQFTRGEQRADLRLRTDGFVQSAADLASLLTERVDDGMLEAVTALRLVLGRPGPRISVTPWRPAVATMHKLAGPAVPLQRRLLRAG